MSQAARNLQGSSRFLRQITAQVRIKMIVPRGWGIPATSPHHPLAHNNARHKAEHSKVIQTLAFKMVLIQRLQPGKVSHCMDLPYSEHGKTTVLFFPYHVWTSHLPHTTEGIGRSLLCTRLLPPAPNRWKKSNKFGQGAADCSNSKAPSSALLWLKLRPSSSTPSHPEKERSHQTGAGLGYEIWD